MRIVAMSGSLRKASFNTGLLRAAVELAPPGVTIDVCDLRAIPPYDDDVRLAGYPAPVEDLRRRVAAANAVLFATPEFNYSIPGVLKNAIDWVSRPPAPPFDGKPFAIMGASTGNYGTTRAQYHLRQMAVFLNMYALNKPEVLVTRAPEKCDADGNLTDGPTRELIAKQLVALVEWTRRLERGAKAT